MKTRCLILLLLPVLSWCSLVGTAADAPPRPPRPVIRRPLPPRFPRPLPIPDPFPQELDDRVAKWSSPLESTPGLVRHFGRVRDSQSIASVITSEASLFGLSSGVRPTIDRIEVTERKWLTSGGHEDIPSFRFRTERWKKVPEPGPRHFLELRPVVNSFGGIQREWGISREYPVGTEFHDILINAATGKTYEHRKRSKSKFGWTSTTIFKDVEARPRGYDGLTQSCNSCHLQTGVAKYGGAAVPGGDTVFSEPLDFDLLKQHPEVTHTRRAAVPPSTKSDPGPGRETGDRGFNPTLPSVERMRAR